MNAYREADDELLVLLCRQGDAEAFASLVARWQERLWRHAARLTGDGTAAWDILQEACIAIARDISRLETAAAFPVWAHRIIANKSCDWLRQHSRRVAREAGYVEQWLLDQPDPVPTTGMIEGLRAARARLAPSDRALLSLRFDDDFSVEEIAGMLNVPSGTVKSRLHYLKQRLRILMEEKP